MNELLLLRHAKSDWHAGLTDFQRPLNHRGQRDAPRLGHWLKDQGLIPDHVISSPAERAKQTVLGVVEVLGVASETIHWEPRIYEAATDTLLAFVSAIPPGRQRVLLVGHNPGMENIVRRLAGVLLEEPDDDNLMPTATLAHLRFEHPWADLPRRGALPVQLMRPKWLPEGY